MSELPEIALARSDGGRPALITGGAGFIGTNLAHRLLTSGCPVLLYDNLSRPGVRVNLEWLYGLHGERVRAIIGDIRDRHSLRRAVRAAGQVYHLAAQVAVTTSLADPALDFEVNARGTLNLLEELRALDNPPPLIFTSTNKVYGNLEDLQLRRNGTRYYPVDPATFALGIGENRSLKFHSPYGCSKGAADQYVSDYARIYGLPAVVFRMSCIYGPHQLGTEDQGWVAHFLIRAVEGKSITIYGDGMQVRDVLYVEDLIDAFLLARAKIDRLSGLAFNIGGGPANTLSLIELIDLIHQVHGEIPRVRFESWRTGDQRFYVSDLRRFQAATGWAPRTSVRDGITRLYRWLLESRRLPVSQMARVGP